MQNNSYYGRLGWNGFTAAAYDVSETGEGALLVASPGLDPPKGTTPNYEVLYTDYDKITVIYSCFDISGSMANGISEYVWILSRDPQISDEDLARGIGVVNQQLPNFDVEGQLNYTSQGDQCPYDTQPQ